MKKQMIISWILGVVFCGCVLSGCGKQKEQKEMEQKQIENAQVAQFIDNVSSISEGVKEELWVIEPEEKEGEWDILPLSELTNTITAEDSVRNSNLINAGYLAAGENGTIFFYSTAQGGIVKADAHGENPIFLLNSPPVCDMQYQNGILYWKDAYGPDIYAYDESLKEVKKLEGITASGFVVVEKGIYVQAENGICFYDFEKNELGEPLCTEGTIWLSAGGNTAFFNRIAESDPSSFIRGEVLTIRDGKTYRLAEHAIAPLFVKDRMYALNGSCSELFSYDYATGEIADDYGYVYLNMVSDGTNTFYIPAYRTEIIKIQEGPNREVFTCSQKYRIHLYISGNCLYYVDIGNSSSNWIGSWYYYDFVTGENGCFDYDEWQIESK